MDVDAAEFRQFQNLRAEDLAECGHNDQIRRPGLQLFHCFRGAHFFRLEQGQAEAKRS